MQIPPQPCTVTDGSAMPPRRHPGETGQAPWRRPDIGGRETKLRDGRRFTRKPGMAGTVSAFGNAAHRASTRSGAGLFILD